MRSTDLNLEQGPPFGLSLLLTAVCACVFLPGLDNPLVSDDWVFVYRGVESDSLGEALDNGGQAWFSRPVVWLLSFVLAQTSGSEAVGFHALSLAFHVANALLLGSFSRLLLVHCRVAEPLSRRGQDFAVCAATAFFMLYPLHHEAVFWYSSITELTVLFGRLLVLHACVRFMYRPRAGASRQLANGVIAMIGMALALASKESAVVQPGVLFLLIAVGAWPRSGESWRCLFRPRAAWVLLAVSSIVTVVWLLWYRSTRGLSMADLMVLEASSGEWALRVAQGVVRTVLGGKIVQDPELLGLAVGLGVAGLALAWWRNQRLALFSSGWLMLCLLPYLSISSVADHEARIPIVRRMVGVADDRYYYSAAAACSFVLLALVLWLPKELARLGEKVGRRAQWCGVTVVFGVSLVGGWRISHYERQWHAAGDLLDGARREIAAEIALPVAKKELICVHTRPDNLQGRYVLRNGVAELLWLHAGHREFRILVPPAAENPNCTRDLFLDG